MSSINRLNLSVDNRRVTVPASIEQKARSKIAANAQNLRRPRPNKDDLNKLVSFFEDDDVAGVNDICAVGVDTGRTSSSFIPIDRRMI